MTHGLTSRYAKAKLAPRIEALKADPEPLNIGDELATARAYLADYLERHAQLDDDQVQVFSKLLDNVTRTVARIEKIRSENAISRQDLRRMVSYMTECMEQIVVDREQQDAIKRLWLKFRYTGQGV